jgi:hypothetical protein
MRMLLLALLCALQATAAQPTPQTEPPAQIVISTKSLKIGPGDTLLLDIKLVNRTGRVLDCTSIVRESGLNEAFAYDVRKQDGKQVLRYPDRLNSGMAAAKPCAVRPNSSLDLGTPDLMRIFQMQEPGSYTIQVRKTFLYYETYDLIANHAKLGSEHTPLTESNVLTINVER